MKPRVAHLKDNINVVYASCGAGDPLVFIHGSLCDYRFWRPQLSRMSDRFNIIAPSLSHYYPALPSMKATRFGWEAHTAQMIAFLEHQADPVHLIGHSRGAAIAYQMALRRPELVGGLTLIDPAGPCEGDDAHSVIDSSAPHPHHERSIELIAAGELDDGLRLFVDSTSNAGTWDRSAPDFQNMARDNARTLALQVRDPLPLYVKARAATLSCPVLLIDGALSPARYRRNAQLLGQWIPNARQASIAGASHGVTWTHPQTFDRVLSAFISTGT